MHHQYERRVQHIWQRWNGPRPRRRSTERRRQPAASRVIRDGRLAAVTYDPRITGNLIVHHHMRAQRPSRTSRFNYHPENRHRLRSPRASRQHCLPHRLERSDWALWTFTSTATGGIPVPGVQITIPSDTSGLHIIDIQKRPHPSGRAPSTQTTLQATTSTTTQA